MFSVKDDKTSPDLDQQMNGVFEAKAGVLTVKALAEQREENAKLVEASLLARCRLRACIAGTKLATLWTDTPKEKKNQRKQFRHGPNRSPMNHRNLHDPEMLFQPNG
ncbi:MAG: hypothetical protein Q9195_001754 [Heterodermia aff. obscurata]